MLLENDNGDAKWQSPDWKGIPNVVGKQLNNCADKGRDIKAVDFGPDGAWYINGVKPDGSGNHSWSLVLVGLYSGNRKNQRVDGLAAIASSELWD